MRACSFVSQRLGRGAGLTEATVRRSRKERLAASEKRERGTYKNIYIYAQVEKVKVPAGMPFHIGLALTVNGKQELEGRDQDRVFALPPAFVSMNQVWNDSAKVGEGGEHNMPWI